MWVGPNIPLEYAITGLSCLDRCSTCQVEDEALVGMGWYVAVSVICQILVNCPGDTIVENLQSSIHISASMLVLCLHHTYRFQSACVQVLCICI